MKSSILEKLKNIIFIFRKERESLIYIEEVS